MADNPLWTCDYCGGRRGLLGKLGGRVHLQCRSCGAQVSFSAMDELVQAEEESARRHHEEALQLQTTHH